MGDSKMNIIEKIKVFWHDSDETNLQAVKGSKGRFDLFLGTLLVGVLLYEDGEWIFSYSNEFKAQDKYEPLVNFPNLTQEYRSNQLWPFFASRLPGVSELKEKGSESMDVLSLLKKYGRHVITNPYKLVAL
jgi:HipA-like protein